MPEDKEWERLKDLKKYFFDSKFGGTNPEEKVYSFFKKDLGVKSSDWVSSDDCRFLYKYYNRLILH